MSEKETTESLKVKSICVDKDGRVTIDLEELKKVKARDRTIFHDMDFNQDDPFILHYIATDGEVRKQSYNSEKFENSRHLAYHMAKSIRRANKGNKQWIGYCHKNIWNYSFYVREGITTCIEEPDVPIERMEEYGRNI